MHAKPDLRVFLEWMIAGSGSVIVDVIQTRDSPMTNPFESPNQPDETDSAIRLPRVSVTILGGILYSSSLVLPVFFPGETTPDKIEWEEKLKLIRSWPT